MIFIKLVYDVPKLEYEVTMVICKRYISSSSLELKKLLVSEGALATCRSKSYPAIPTSFQTLCNTTFVQYSNNVHGSNLCHFWNTCILGVFSFDISYNIRLNPF